MKKAHVAVMPNEFAALEPLVSVTDRGVQI